MFFCAHFWVAAALVAGLAVGPRVAALQIRSGSYFGPVP
ncbi:MAG: hypothetical protein HY000_21700 [Planctomycetes bacterium]|nr:hypothetical protein [Planctomycetota bacterium]